MSIRTGGRLVGFAHVGAKMRHRVGFLSVMLSAAIVAAAASPAAATIGAPFNVSAAANNASAPEVAVVESTGDVVYVWERFDGANSRIETRTRSAAGVLGDVKTLSSANQDALAPQVAVDVDGDAVFTWARFDGTNWRIQARARSAAGTLSPVQDISAGGRDAYDFNCLGCAPRLDVDAVGNAVFVWRRFDGTNWRIETRARTFAGALSPVQSVSDPGATALFPDIAVDADGDAILAWTRHDGSNWRAQSRVRTAAGGLGAVQNLSDPGQSAYGVEVDATPAGDAVYSWARFDDTDFRVQARARSAAGTFSGVQTLSAENENVELTSAHVGVDSDGDATFAWLVVGDSNTYLRTRSRSTSGTLGAVQTLDIDVSDPGVAVGPGGEALFTWQGLVCNDESCVSVPTAQARSATGELSSAQVVGEFGEEIAAAVDAGGGATVVWRGSDGTNNRVQAATGPATGTFANQFKASAAGRTAGGPQVAVDDAGGSVFTWARAVADPFDGTFSNYVIQAQARSAAGVLGPVRDLSTGPGLLNEPDVAINRSTGDAVFVWRRFDGAHWRIEARALSASGILSPVQTLSDGGQDAFSPQVAVDLDGDAVFTWARFDGTSWRVQARARSASGVLEPVQTLSSGGEDAFDGACECGGPELGIGAGGTATVVWRRFDGTNWRIQARSRTSSGALSAVQTLSAGGADADEHEVAVDPNGNAVVIWTRSTATASGNRPRAQARTRSSAGTLGAVKNLFSGDSFNSTADQFGPNVAVDGAGNAVLAWTQIDDFVPSAMVAMRTLSSGGVLGSQEQISLSHETPGALDVGTDLGGDAVFLWTSRPGLFSSGTNAIRARERTSSGALSAVQTLGLSGLSRPQEPALAVGTQGDPAAVFSATDREGNSRIVVATSP